ncbi:MAG: AraC family transcriptional regulator [Treponema sp.]|nr:AraC family transcriptional regulator [Treponema sp.]
MDDELLSRIEKLPSDQLVMFYMDLVSKHEAEEVYRLREPIGQGIMKHTHIAPGIELVYSELESYCPNYQAEKKEFDSIEIMYIAEGHGDFELMNRQVISGDKGDVLLFNSKTSTKNCNLGKNGMNCLSLLLFPAQAIDFLNDFFSSKEFTLENFLPEIRSSDSCVKFAADDLLEKLFLEMMQRSSKYSAYYIKLAVIYSLLLILKDPQNPNHSDLYFSGNTGRKVQQVRRLINSNLEKEISIEELAAKVNLNRTSLQKVFKEMYGVTINTFRTQARIQEAKNLLLSTDLSITAIAGMCGYSNASKFSSVFKSHCGLLPKDWRAQNKV